MGYSGARKSRKPPALRRLELTFSWSDEVKYYGYYLGAWTVMAIVMLPVIMFSKKFLERYPKAPPQDQKQLYNTTWYLYVGGIFVLISSLVEQFI